MSSAPLVGETAAQALAERAHALVQADPRGAEALAEQALALAAAAGDTKGEVSARYALGWALHALGEPSRGSAALRAGIRLAERTGDDRGEGLLRRRLAFQLSIDGRHQAARRELDRALALLSGLDRAQSQVHRIEIVRRGAREDADLHRRVTADAAAALRRLRREGDALWEARLLFNRGLLRLDRGEFARAEADVGDARLLYARAGAGPAAANASAVLAQIALLRGDVLGCLRLLEPIDASSLPGLLAYQLQECRVLAFTQARLLPEARAAAEAYMALCARTGGGDFVPNVALDLASIALMAGDANGASRFASTAMRSFTVRRKPVEAALARASVLRARLAEGRTDAASIRSGLEAARVLESAGWRREAARTRLLVARFALARGSVEVARRELNLAQGLRTIGLVQDRVALYHGQALLSLADTKPALAERRLLRGMRMLDEYQAALGAIELRALSSGIGAEIARDGLRMAFQGGRPERILAWTEQYRANTFRVPAVQPPSDARLRGLQSELRDAVTRNAVATQARLEEAIRTRTRLAGGRADAGAAIPEVAAATRALGTRSLIEYLEVDDLLYALTLTEGTLALHRLGGKNSYAELEWLHFGFARLARGRMTPEQRVTARAGANAAAQALDAALAVPLRDAVADAPLVIVPTGALHALPWAALPSLRGRPIAVAPSLALWCDLAARPRSRRRKTALVAGPRLRHVDREVQDIAALRPGATVLTGKASTAEATLAALDGAAIAHLACHGHFRGDSPLFSSLELADGPLNVYELQRLRRAPELVVLSACDLALSQTHPGDELLGLAAALLGMGTRTIVASVVPVPDAAARHVMLAFHRHLLDGLAPAEALARAQARARTAGFVCLGLG